MMMSSAATSGLSLSSVCSTRPAGIISQMLRGVSSMLTNVARSVEPLAPSSSSDFTASALMS